MLDQITPVLLTYNEDQNIARVMSQLMWAKDVVVVDSGSSDRTLAILSDFRNVRVFHRAFDTHANQWRYATQDTNIDSEWILRLDADYNLTNALVAELSSLEPDRGVVAYRIGFDYAVFSRKLLSSLYPSNTVLLRKGYFSIYDEGHTERWKVDGEVATLRARIVHDDWKPTARWIMAQARYMQLEVDSFHNHQGGLARWLRLRPPLMPIAAFLYCLFGKGLLLNGRAGVYYALQRTVAECILALFILETKFRAESSAVSDNSSSVPE